MVVTTVNAEKDWNWREIRVAKERPKFSSPSYFFLMAFKGLRMTAFIQGPGWWLRPLPGCLPSCLQRTGWLGLLPTHGTVSTIALLSMYSMYDSLLSLACSYFAHSLHNMMKREQEEDLLQSAESEICVRVRCVSEANVNHILNM